MLSAEVMRRIREVELYTRRLVSGSLIGDTSSAIKGTGFEFDQIRDYQPGDDVRFIDWNSSGRMNKLLVKQYVEERNRTIMLAVDISSSTSFASHAVCKSETIEFLAAVLALVSEYGKDKIGLITFSDTVHTMVVPKKGRSHTRMLMEHLFNKKPAQVRQTSLVVVLKELMRLKLKNATVFLLSDFIDTELYEKELAIVSRIYDLIAVRVRDKHEYQLPQVGLLPIVDVETKRPWILDTRGSSSKSINEFLKTYATTQEMRFKKNGIDLLDIDTNNDYMGDLIRFFRRRMRY